MNSVELASGHEYLAMETSDMLVCVCVRLQWLGTALGGKAIAPGGKAIVAAIVGMCSSLHWELNV